MISQPDKVKVIHILDRTMGVGSPLKTDERLHYCPFCHHHKKKMNVNVETGQFHCWVCDAKGLRIYNLLKRLDVDKRDLKNVRDIYGDDYVRYKQTDEPKVELRLPREFITLTIPVQGFNPMYKRVQHYLKTRGITDDDISRYGMGYCNGGKYNGRLIIPSYDSDNQLNYFIARSVFEDEPFKYKNPPVSKNIVALGNQIDWSKPITLCEGIFDAIAIKRNAIPIFGKFIPKTLMDMIFKNGVTEIRIMLDADAQKQALRYTEYFQKQGIKTTNIVPQAEDAADMGFGKVNKLIKETPETTFTDIIAQKLKN